MTRPAFNKLAEEAYDIIISYLNIDPTIIYSIQSILSVIATRRTTGADVSTTILDSNLQTSSGNQLIIWVKSGGNVGEYYDIDAKVQMTTGQIISRQIELFIAAKQ